MADLKISQLTAATTLQGDEEFPMNDSGTTKKITAANLSSQLAGMQPQDAGGGGGTSAVGTPGATGATGSAGGATGATGVAGMDGIDGGNGPRGGTGASGATGVGATGATGPAGLDGIDGRLGATGASGTAGSNGATGASGSPGGATGATGVAGSPGGATGATGIAGIDGIDGMPGRGGGLHDAYALIRDEKAAGTEGGTFTSGAWRTRDLNTEVFDPSGIVSISSNQFTLLAGTYFIYARAPAYAGVDHHKAKLYNVTDAADVIIGSTESINQINIMNDSIVQGRFTITATKTFEIQHRAQTTRSTDGFGSSFSFSVVEVYTEVEIWREGTGSGGGGGGGSAGATGATGAAGNDGIDGLRGPPGSAVLYNQELSGDGSFDVSNIPGGYGTLLCVLHARGTTTQQNLLCRLNNDSGTKYSAQVVTASGGTIAGAGGGLSDQTAMHVSYVTDGGAAGTAMSMSLQIPDYDDTTFHKYLTADSSITLASFYRVSTAGAWHDTSAVTRIAFFAASGSFKSGSRLTIYGLG